MLPRCEASINRKLSMTHQWHFCLKVLCVTQVAVQMTSACGLLPHATSMAALLKVLSVQHIAVQMMTRCGLLISRELLSVVRIAALVRVLSVWMEPATTRQAIISDCRNQTYSMPHPRLHAIKIFRTQQMVVKQICVCGLLQKETILKFISFVDTHLLRGWHHFTISHTVVSLNACVQLMSGCCVLHCAFDP